MNIYKKALRKFGDIAQKLKCIEELSELIRALIRDLNAQHDDDNLAEEIADVEIMIEQVKISKQLHKRVSEFKAQKLNRLEDLCEE